MDSLELLRKIKNKDSDAFDELMSKYGMSVYMRLLGQLGDKELADEAFKMTMLEFYSFVAALEGEDIVEAMLFARADHVQQSIVGSSLNRLISEMKEELGASAAELAPTAETMLIPEGETRDVELETPESRAALIVEPECGDCDGAYEDDAPTQERAEESPAPAARADTPEPEKAEIIQTAAETASPAAETASPAAETITPAADTEKKTKSGGRGIGGMLVVTLLALAVLAAVWTAVGELIAMGVLPCFDLGYEWFNVNIYPLFRGVCFCYG